MKREFEVSRNLAAPALALSGVFGSLDTVTTRIWEEDYSADAFSEELVDPYMEKVVQDAAEIYESLHDAFQEEADEFLAQIEKILSALQYALDFTERWKTDKVNPEIDNT